VRIPLNISRVEPLNHALKDRRMKSGAKAARTKRWREFLALHCRAKRLECGRLQRRFGREVHAAGQGEGERCIRPAQSELCAKQKRPG